MFKWRVSGKALSWALYDWANSGFATTVMAGFFPLFFKQFYCAGIEPAISTARLGWGSSAASLAVALFAPFAGAAADACTGKKRLLLWFTTGGTVATALLALPEQGQWAAAIGIYACALFLFAGGNIFYDSLLADVAGPEERDRVSSLGFALGYLGGGILLLLNIGMVLMPSVFGIAGKEQAVRLSFILVALWWLIFSLPLFFRVTENRTLQCDSKSVGKIITRLADTFLRIRAKRAALLFLAAYWLYMDGVSSIIRMAVDYGLSIGIGSKGLLGALLLVQFTGFPATLLMSHVAERIGTRNTLIVGITAYASVTLWASIMNTVQEFFILAAAIGLFQGSLQALSRSFFSRLIPRGREAEFFGFYNIVGRFAAILGPALIGTVAIYTGSTRAGILVLLPIFAAGAILLSRVET